MPNTSNEEEEDQGEEKEMKIMTVASRPPTAAREPVGIANVNINGIMKTFLRTGRYCTSPNRLRPLGDEIPRDINLAETVDDARVSGIECGIPSGNPNHTGPNRVRPQGAEIEQDIEMAMSFSNSNETINDALVSECDSPSGNPNYTGPNRVRPLGAEIEQDIELATSFSNPNVLTIPSQIAGGRGHFITRFLTSTGPADVPDTGKNLESSSWTSLLTQSMSILGGGYGGKNFSENNGCN
jgi:hypothetical protein